MQEKLNLVYEVAIGITWGYSSRSYNIDVRRTKGTVIYNAK